MVNISRAEPVPPLSKAAHHRTRASLRCVPMAEQRPPPLPPAGSTSRAAAGLIPGALSAAAAPSTAAATAAAAPPTASPPQTQTTPTTAAAAAPTPPVPPSRTTAPAVQRPPVLILPRPGPNGRGGLPASPAAGRGGSDERQSTAPRGRGRHHAPGRGGLGRAPVPGQQPGRVETQKRQRYTKWNQQCAMCNQGESGYGKRLKLCEDNQKCGRWVHKSKERNCFAVLFHTRATAVQARCCMHHQSLKGACRCHRYVPSLETLLLVV